MRKLERSADVVAPGAMARDHAPLLRFAAPRRVAALEPDEPVSRKPSIPPPGGKRKHIRSYQIEGAEWLRARKRALLADEPGTGKTVQFLRALPRRARAIVVCPAHLQLVWVDEGAEWRSDLAVVPDELRSPAPGEVVVASIDSLPAPRPGFRMSLLPGVDLSGVTLGVDEAQYCKNPTTARTQRVRLLARQCGRVWLLTGTPLQNTPPDLWTVLDVGRLATEAYGDKRQFQESFSMRKEVIYVRPYVDATGHKRNTRVVTRYGEPTEEARAGLARVMLRRKQSDVLDELPAVIEKTIRVAAPKDLRESLDETLDAWEKWGDPNALPPFELLSAALSKLAESRAPAALEHVRAALTEGPIVVFSAFRAPVLALASLPRTVVVTGDVPARDRQGIAKAFQAGEYDCVAGTIDAMGTGLTLTRAARLLLIDESYVPAENLQAIGRLLRHGQRRAVLVERMVSDHPLDRRRAQILASKTRLIEEVVG